MLGLLPLPKLQPHASITKHSQWENCSPQGWRAHKWLNCWFYPPLTAFFLYFSHCFRCILLVQMHVPVLSVTSWVISLMHILWLYHWIKTPYSLVKDNPMNRCKTNPKKSLLQPNWNKKNCVSVSEKRDQRLLWSSPAYSHPYSILLLLAAILFGALSTKQCKRRTFQFSIQFNSALFIKRQITTIVISRHLNNMVQFKPIGIQFIIIII